MAFQGSSLPPNLMPIIIKELANIILTENIKCQVMILNRF